MSRNARGNENGRFDKISSNRANVHGIGDFGKFWSNSSKRNQVIGFDDFGECSPFSLLHAFLAIPVSIIILAFFSSVSPLYLYCQHLKTLTPISDQDKISPYINNIYQADK